jgi:hypothetical protein
MVCADRPAFVHDICLKLHQSLVGSTIDRIIAIIGSCYFILLFLVVLLGWNLVQTPLLVGESCRLNFNILVAKIPDKIGMIVSQMIAWLNPQVMIEVYSVLNLNYVIDIGRIRSLRLPVSLKSTTSTDQWMGHFRIHQESWRPNPHCDAKTSSIFFRRKTVLSCSFIHHVCWLNHVTICLWLTVRHGKSLINGGF